MIPSGDKARPAAEKIHPADVIHLAGDHVRAICRDDAPQIGQRHRQPVLGQQTIDPQPSASAADYLF